jgi:hypothetical protein
MSGFSERSIDGCGEVPADADSGSARAARSGAADQTPAAVAFLYSPAPA